MEFRNLTPFHALAYEAVDTQDREYHVVAMAVGYRLVPVPAEVQARLQRQGLAWRPTHELQLLDDSPATLPLALADEHWGDPATTSLRRESDLVPYKPRCDVCVVGDAYSEAPQREFEARLRVEQGSQKLIDKAVTLTGPRYFERGGAFSSAVLRALDEAKVYSLSTTEATTRVPLRYELAYGGHCRVDAAPAGLAQGGGSQSVAPLINEVCLRNPVGAGWIATGYLDALARTPQGLPERLPAPQISKGRPPGALTRTAPLGAMTPAQMATVRYPHEVAGLSALGKAWAPRLALAGTADEAWQRERAPELPLDFDFGFWNGAPQDQQIPFPDLSEGLRLLAQGLLPGGSYLRVQLPFHRAFALMRLDNGLVLPNPMQIDLIELDNQAPGGPVIRLVFRTAVLQSTGVRVLESRFQADPAAPLFTLAPSTHYQKPNAASLQADAVKEAPHG